MSTTRLTLSLNLRPNLGSLALLAASFRLQYLFKNLNTKFICYLTFSSNFSYLEVPCFSVVFKEVGAGTDEGKVVGGGLEAGAGEIRKEVTDGVEERSGGDGERS